MGTFTYKLNPDDTFAIGDSSNSVIIAGSLAAPIAATYESVTTTGTADVVDPDIKYSLVTSAGAHTVTLADGSFAGQEKTVILSVDGGTITLTPANFADGTSLTFADILDTATLIFDGTDWNLAAASGVAIVA